MNKHNLKVGQRIFVDDMRGKVTEYEISKIGRKWAEYKWPEPRHQYVVGRFDLETLSCESSNAQKVWLSLEAREQARKLYAEWHSFRDAVTLGYVRPAAATLENIAEARRLLGL